VDSGDTWEVCWETVYSGAAGQVTLRGLQGDSVYRFRARQLYPEVGYGDWSIPRDLRTHPNISHSKVELPFSGQPFAPEGLFYHVGTEQQSQPFYNPAASGLVQVSCSNHAVGDLSLVVDRCDGSNYTANEKGSWFAVSLDAQSAFQASHYSLRHDSDFLRPLRHWVLEASWDGYTWTALLEHIDDDSLRQEPGAVAAWQLPDDAQLALFRHFRVRITGPNAHGGHTLCLAGLELYGMLWCF